MKKSTGSILLVLVFLFSGLFLLSYSVTAQEVTVVFPSLPANINAIVAKSCVPCHTSKGGFMSKGILNFTEWDKYSPAKQKGKAEKMSSVLKKGGMPPKSARENRPEIIPTQDQIDIIVKWAESLKPDSK